MPPPMNLTAMNATRGYSPVTLNQDWPKLERLLFIVCCSCIGTILNGFFVAAFFVEPTLKRVGNVFLACIGLADLIVTTAVMPVSAVVLLSGEWDTIPVCHVQQFLTETSTYCYSMFFMLVGAETFYRICRPSGEYDMFISMRVGLVSVLVFVLCFLTGGIGVYLRLDYDYCQRLHYGNFYFRVTTLVMFHGIPFLVTIIGLIAAVLKLHKRVREQPQYKRSQQYDRDNSTIIINICAYLTYVIAWLPYIIAVHEFPGTTNSKFYHCVWIGVCRSVITSFMYCSANRSFRRAFAHLFNYCCCKSTLSGSFSNRHRRAMDYKPACGDVRVHIMHQAVNTASSQRAAASSSREMQEL